MRHVSAVIALGACACFRLAWLMLGTCTQILKADGRQKRAPVRGIRGAMPGRSVMFALLVAVTLCSCARSPLEPWKCVRTPLLDVRGDTAAFITRSPVPGYWCAP